jgi:hypothetical protein
VARLALSFGLLSAWLALLLLGWSFGGAVYLLLVAALATFPWRLMRPAAAAGTPAAAVGDGASPRANGPAADAESPTRR